MSNSKFVQWARNLNRMATAGPLMAGLLACTPTYNWRELAVEGGLNAWMPCKPQIVSREVSLGTQTLVMKLYACEAGGQNWAISDVAQPDAAQLSTTQAVLNEAVAANLGARLGRAQVPDARGLSQAKELRQYLLHGRRHDGADLTVLMWSFVRGNQVYQATVIQPEGGQTSFDDPDVKDARDTFFGALRFAG